MSFQKAFKIKQKGERSVTQEYQNMVMFNHILIIVNMTVVDMLFSQLVKVFRILHKNYVRNVYMSGHIHISC